MRFRSKSAAKGQFVAGASTKNRQSAAKLRGQWIVRAAVEGLETRRLLTNTIVVNTLADTALGDPSLAGPISLRQAINYENNNGGGTITFDPTLNGQTIALNGSALQINGAIVIDGGSLPSGLSVSGSNASGVVIVNASAIATINGLAIIQGNAAGSGGGISNVGTLTLTNDTIANNTSNDLGGGVSNSGTLTLANDTIANNASATGIGGGIGNVGALTATNTTICGNSASQNMGGGIGNRGTITTLTNDTIVNNFARIGHGTSIDTDGTGTLTMNNSLVFGNNGSDGRSGLISGSNNMIGIPAGYTSVASILATDASGNPLLASNGGRTQTIALVAGSPAIGTGAPVAGVTTDQRGYGFSTTPAAIDIGAYQSAAVAPEAPSLKVTTPTDTVNSFDGVTSLREAINYAETQPGNAAITFASNLNGQTILLGGTQLEIAGGTVSIDAGNLTQGVAISGQGASRVFLIDNGATVTLNGLTIENGLGGFTDSTGPNGGGILNNGTLTATNDTITGNSSLNSGGGIANTGTLVTTHNIISGNSSGGGVGGAGILNTGTLISTGDTIVNNTTSKATSGGGVRNNGTATLTNDTIAGNQSGAGSGGGIFNSATLTAINDTIANNTSDGGANGGGVSNVGSATLTNVTIIGNVARLGGGIFNARTLTATNATISGNSVSASGTGGGIFNAPAGTLQLANSIVANSQNGQDLASTSIGSISGSNDLLDDNSDISFLTNSTNNVNPMLGALADNGGPTQTIALLPGSPAIGAGVSIAGVTTDQRGVFRPTQPSIGAYEANPAGPSVLSKPAVASRVFVADWVTLSTQLTSASAPATGVSGAAVTFTVTDASSVQTTYNAVTGADGTASTKFSPTAGGIYTITASFGGSNTLFATTSTAASTTVYQKVKLVLTIPTGSIASETTGPVIKAVVMAEPQNTPVTGVPVYFDSSAFPWWSSGAPADSLDANGVSSIAVTSGFSGTFPISARVKGGDATGYFLADLNGTIGVDVQSALGSLTITQAVASLSAISLPTNVTAGQNVRLTTQLTLVTGQPGPISGNTVTFTIIDPNGQQSTPSATTDANGSASVFYVPAFNGTYSIVASYVPDQRHYPIPSAYSPASSTPVNLIVGVPTTTVVVPSTPSTVYGNAQSVSVTVAANGFTPTGTVQFFIDGNPTPIGSAPLINGQVASWTLPTQNAGSHSIVAVYVPDNNSSYVASTSLAASVSVTPAALTITAKNQSMIAGQSPPAFSYTVSGFAFPTETLSQYFSGSVALNCSVTASSPPGAYPIFSSINGLVALSAAPQNFVITTVFNGILDVNEAPSLVVTTMQDVVDPEDGKTSLREAIAYADSGTSNPNPTITFDPSLTGKTITLNGTQLEMTATAYPVVINAATIGGMTISGNSASRVFMIDSGANVTLNALTITNGKSGNGSGADGAGIYNLGTLTATNDTITDSLAPNGNGGGIYNAGTLTATNDVITGNTAFAHGGGIHNGGTLIATNDTISGNRSINGTGGGILNSGTLTATNDAIVGNSAPYGGGVHNLDGTFTAINDTIANNLAPFGGGIANDGTFTATNITVAGNTARVQGGGIRSSGTLQLNNSIVANSVTGGDLFVVDGSSTSGSNDLIGDGGNLSLLANSISGDPRLAPLASNGGPTQTMALLPGSPAINAGNNNAAVDANNVTLATDQRGVGYPRIVGGTVDIGAYEVQSVGTSTSVIANNTADVYGQNQSLTATVTATSGVPSGIVSFSLNGTSVALGAGLLVNGTATWVLTPSQLRLLTATNHLITAIFYPDNGSLYTTSQGVYNLSVARAQVTITANSVSSVYGNAIAPLTFSLNSALAFPNETLSSVFSVLPTPQSSVSSTTQAGVYAITMSPGVPNSPQNYDFTYVDGFYTLLAATPTITMVNPVNITFGTALSNSQLNGTTSVPGVFTYTTDAGKRLNAGAGQIENVTFTPTDTIDYSTITSTVLVNVAKAQPTVSVSATGGGYNGNPFAATATVTGISGIAASTLESVTPTLAYYVGSTASGVSSPTAPTNAGTYTVVATFGGSADYTSTSTSTTFTIAQATPSISVTPTSGTYNGSAFAATGGATGVGGVSLTPVTLTYFAAGDTNHQNAIPAPTNAGSYVAVATYGGSTNYTAVSVSKAFTITQTTPSISVTPTGGTYNGSAFVATGSATGVGGVSLTPVTLAYFAAGDTSYQNAIPAPTNAGSYVAVATYGGSTNYTAVSVSKAFSITQATPSVSVTPASGIYNGSAFVATGSALGVGGVSLTPVTLAYYLASDTSHLTAIPAPTNVGSYVAVATYGGSTNYTAVSTSKAFNITQATPSVSATATGGTYNGSAFAGTGSATGVGGVSLTPVTLTYYLASDTNHLNAIAAPTNVGSYVAVATYAGSTNYVAVTVSKAFTITQATPGVSITAAGGDYNGSAFIATASATGVGGVALTPVTLTYYAASDTNRLNAIAAPTNVGSYVVVASYAGSTNYAAISASKTFAITKATSTLSTAAVTVAYGGTATLSATLTTSSGALLAGRTVSFTFNGKVIGTAVTNASGVATLNASAAGINPGVLTTGVQVSFAGDTNSAAVSASNSVTIIDAAIVAKGATLAIPILPIALTLGTFTQARTGAAASDFVVTVDFGDGTGLQKATVIADPLHAGQFDIVGPLHLYANILKSYTVTVTISTVAKFGVAAGAMTTFSNKITA